MLKVCSVVASLVKARLRIFGFHRTCDGKLHMLGTRVHEVICST